MEVQNKFFIISALKSYKCGGCNYPMRTILLFSQDIIQHGSFISLYSFFLYSLVLLIKFISFSSFYREFLFFHSVSDQVYQLLANFLVLLANFFGLGVIE